MAVEMDVMMTKDEVWVPGLQVKQLLPSQLESGETDGVESEEAGYLDSSGAKHGIFI